MKAGTKIYCRCGAQIAEVTADIHGFDLKKDMWRKVKAESEWMPAHPYSAKCEKCGRITNLVGEIERVFKK